MESVLGDTVVYRAERARFIIGTAFLLIPTGVAIALLYWDFADRDTGQLFLAVLLLGLCSWMDIIVIMKALWPPEVRIGVHSFAYTNRGLLIRGTSHAWDELDGPTQVSGSGGVPLVQMIVKATNKKLRFPPSHFGANYDEMAAVITAAQKGQLVDPMTWRASHPRISIPGWVAPLLLLVGLVGGLLWAFGFLDSLLR
jgi:hypothetical protein